jgi:type II secretory pathway predicted ATPase ExeA
MTVRAGPLAFDPASPPVGVRLNFPDVAARLRVTVTDMCRATNLGRASVARLFNNEWPVRNDAGFVRSALTALLAERGAETAELATLFHARVSAQARRAAAKAVAPAARAEEDAPEPPKEDESMLLAKQTLSRQARQAFGLFRNPFDSHLQPDDEIYVNSEFAFVREACLQAALNSSFVALVGESGSGKSTTVESLEDAIQRDRKNVIVIRPSVLGMEDRMYAGKPVKAGDILQAIVTTLDTRASPKQTVEARSTQAVQLLRGSVEAGNQHLLLIEEAHSMSDFTLKHLKRLHEMKLGRRPLLGILLVGQPELKAKLDPRRAALREVTQRCEMVELLPLDNDLKAYLAHRAKVVGASLDKMIDDAGIEELRRRLTVEKPGAGGQRRVASLLYPLAVNNMMTAAMNMAAELGAPIVNRDVVRAV